MAMSKKRGARDWFRNEEEKGSASLSRRNQPAGSELAPVPYFGPLAGFFPEVDRLFERAMRSFGMPGMMSMPGMMGLPDMMNMFRPKLDIAANDDEYTITAEVPGLEEKDLQLDCTNDGLLIIRGERRQEGMQKEAQLKEISYGSFERVLTLPEDADKESIEARFKNGLLIISVPRLEERSQIRQIPISGKGGKNESNAPSNPGSAPRKVA